MRATDNILDRLQADIFATLQAVPGLAIAQVFRDDEKNLQGRVDRALALRAHAGGKAGLAIVVESIEVADTEANLPGPVMKLNAKVVTIENVSVNRSATLGTGITSSQAAIRILSALHLRQIGSFALHAAPKAILPQNLAEGISAHLVTLSCLVGVTVAGKVQALSAEMVAGTSFDMIASGELEYDGEPIAPDVLLREEELWNGKPRYFTEDGDLSQRLYWEAGRWNLEMDGARWHGAGDTSLPNDPAVIWTVDPFSPYTTGIPTISVAGGGQALELSCMTSGSAIYYTTDGSYPTPSNGTLYAAPFTLPEAGTVIRAAAYASGLNPSDCLELAVTE